MISKKIRILFVFLLIATSGYCQSRMTVFFKFGSSKLSANSQREIDVFMSGITAEYIDSIQFIGFTDSVGKGQANTKLSLKRAKNTSDYFAAVLGNNIPLKILAMGEGSAASQEINRRVEVNCFLSTKKESVVPIIIENAEPDCFFIDYDALDNCTFKVLKVRRKEYVYLQSDKGYDIKKRKLFYVREDGENIKIQRINWKLEIIGVDWWCKQRYTALIPKDLFYKYKIFKLDNGPCQHCSVEQFGSGFYLETDVMDRRNYFIENNYQLKTNFARIKLFKKIFNRRNKSRNKKIMVPKDFVNVNEVYFIKQMSRNGYSAGDSDISWKTKKFRKKYNGYYFAKVNIVGSQFRVYNRKYISTCMYAGGGMGGASGKLNFFAINERFLDHCKVDEVFNSIGEPFYKVQFLSSDFFERPATNHLEMWKLVYPHVKQTEWSLPHYSGRFWNKISTQTALVPQLGFDSFGFYSFTKKSDCHNSILLTDTIIPREYEYRVNQFVTGAMKRRSLFFNKKRSRYRIKSSFLPKTQLYRYRYESTQKDSTDWSALELETVNWRVRKFSLRRQPYYYVKFDYRGGFSRELINNRLVFQGCNVEKWNPTNSFEFDM